MKEEKKNYYNNFFHSITCNQRVYNWRYIKRLRKGEFYRYKLENSINPFWKILYIINRFQRNRLGVIAGIEIPENTFDTGLIIHHCGNIVVNGYSKIGKNCQLHGDNCIGNAGDKKKLDACPKIGNNVDIGVGAKIIGDVVIADNIIIGANAVVTKSFLEEGITIVGIPAHKL